MTCKATERDSVLFETRTASLRLKRKSEYLDITMDIVIDIQGFCDADEKFIPKEVAVVALNSAIIGHWIMTPPYPFDDLPEKSRRENNWLSRNYHGIEWFDGETDLKCFVIQLREITRRVRYIYSRGQEKARYLRRLLSRNVYNLEGISPAFKNLPEDKESGHRCSHHGFRFCSTDKFLCALRNAGKLKRWIGAQNTSSECSIVSSCDDLSRENWSISEKADSGVFMKKNKNLDIIRNIEAWRTEKKEEEEDKNQSRNYIAKDISCVKKEEYPTDSNAQQTISAQSFENVYSTRKEINPCDSTIQIIPRARAPSCYATNEFVGNLTRVASSQCQICGSLSCRQTTEGVDEVDSHCR
ncbi:uncharacterized protein [Linepithema humile]|uniref:uncharacterized protein n=1 Tax=Linepithema humile TaxID=83485 RepID=UPI00351E7A0F